MPRDQIKSNMQVIGANQVKFYSTVFNVLNAICTLLYSTMQGLRRRNL